ncbi:hypothetical protein JCM8547_000900 [Rhodosporidiobolus lusitaniae]
MQLDFILDFSRAASPRVNSSPLSSQGQATSNIIPVPSPVSFLPFTDPALQPYLPLPPPTTDSSAFPEELNTLLSALLPSATLHELTTSTTALGKAGIHSMSDLSTLPLTETSSLATLNAGLKHRGGTDDEYVVLARVMRALREGAKKDGFT